MALRHRAKRRMLVKKYEALSVVSKENLGFSRLDKIQALYTNGVWIRPKADIKQVNRKVEKTLDEAKTALAQMLRTAKAAHKRKQHKPAVTKPTVDTPRYRKAKRVTKRQQIVTCNACDGTFKRGETTTRPYKFDGYTRHARVCRTCINKGA